MNANIFWMGGHIKLLHIRHLNTKQIESLPITDCPRERYSFYRENIAGSTETLHYSRRYSKKMFLPTPESALNIFFMLTLSYLTNRYLQHRGPPYSLSTFVDAVPIRLVLHQWILREWVSLRETPKKVIHFHCKNGISCLEGENHRERGRHWRS